MTSRSALGDKRIAYAQLIDERRLFAPHPIALDHRMDGINQMPIVRRFDRSCRRAGV